jgi:hypothetical protein
VKPVSRTASFIKLLTQNGRLKLLSLALSVGLFSIVHSDQDAQRSLFVDVVTVLPPPSKGRMLISEIPDQVKVTLRGSRTRISAIDRCRGRYTSGVDRAAIGGVDLGPERGA